MKLTKSLFLPTLILLLLSSCGSQKDIAYMQDGEYLKSVSYTHLTLPTKA